MLTIKFIYKCKRCGKIFSSEGKEYLWIGDNFLDLKYSEIQLPYHKCIEGNLGASELIGADTLGDTKEFDAWNKRNQEESRTP